MQIADMICGNYPDEPPVFVPHRHHPLFVQLFAQAPCSSGVRVSAPARGCGTPVVTDQPAQAARHGYSGRPRCREVTCPGQGSVIEIAGG